MAKLLVRRTTEPGPTTQRHIEQRPGLHRVQHFQVVEIDFVAGRFDINHLPTDHARGTRGKRQLADDFDQHVSRCRTLCRQRKRIGQSASPAKIASASP